MVPGVVGVVLAGGQARRMGGGDKCLLRLGDLTLLEHILNSVTQQVEHVVLNANDDLSRFAQFGLATVADAIDGHAGPLAGILSGMIWARRNVPGARWIASFPGDSPFLPADLVERLHGAVSGANAELGTVFSGDQAQPVCGLWPVRLADALRDAIEQRDIRKVDAWTRGYRCARVVYKPQQAGASLPDPFFNINSPDDLKTARRYL